MPVITMEGPQITDQDKKRQLVATISEAAAEAYGLPIEKIVILLKENDPGNVAVGGNLIADRR